MSECKHFSQIITKDGSVLYKCDINNNDQNLAYHVDMKAVFESQFPNRELAANGECVFRYIGERAMEKCPYKKEV